MILVDLLGLSPRSKSVNMDLHGSMSAPIISNTKINSGSIHCVILYSKSYFNTLSGSWIAKERLNVFLLIL